MVIKPMIRNNICMNAHPVGCFEDVKRQIAYVKSKGSFDGPKKALVIGASTGYGLASRIALAYGAGTQTIGVSFEKEPSETKVGTMGWYNIESFEKLAKEAGIVSESINADAFSHETRKLVIEKIKALLGQIDLLVYSIASPVRTDPDTGVMYKSVLKPLKANFTDRSVNMMTGEVKEATIEASTNPAEIEETIKVMGGDDWALWIDALKAAGVLSKGFVTVAYSYIGPEVTFAVYRDGTIGKAKEHLEGTVAKIDKKLADLGGKSWVSENKGLVTRASAVIPVVPLYFSILYKIMKAKGIHEACIEQMQRLFKDKLYAGSNKGINNVPNDKDGLIRMDDWELRDDVQAEVKKLWGQISTENVYDLTDLKGCFQDFLNIHGFGIETVDYEADVSTFFPKA